MLLEQVPDPKQCFRGVFEGGERIGRLRHPVDRRDASARGPRLDDQRAAEHHARKALTVGGHAIGHRLPPECPQWGMLPHIDHHTEGLEVDLSVTLAEPEDGEARAESLAGAVKADPFWPRRLLLAWPNEKGATFFRRILGRVATAECHPVEGRTTP
jgi:hypothetical protein